MGLEQLSLGDHIYVSRKIFLHHGIFIGNNQIIDYSDTESKHCIRIRNIYDFLQGEKEFYIKQYGNCDSFTKVIKRAKSRLGEDQYNFFKNNCEHFAYWCKTGINKSDQVKKAVSVNQAGIENAVTGVGATLKYSASKATAKQSLNPLSKLLVNVGLKEAPKVAGRTAAGIAGAAGIVTGVATDYAVKQCLEDDKHLTQKELEARKAGRIASSVGTTVGGIGGGIAAMTIGGGIAVGAAIAAPVVLGVAAATVVYQMGKDEDIKVVIP